MAEVIALRPTAPPEATRPLLTTDALSLELGGRRLLDRATIGLAEGRRTVIAGPNGAGKSLLLRLMHGLLRPTAGQINWRGQPMIRRDRAEQAMVFQRPVLLRRSVRANLSFALPTWGLSREQRRDRIAEALAHAGLEHKADQPARALSIGEQQRLAMARALLTRPTLLLLDEPTASLDPASTLAIEALVHRASAAGTTVALVTHDLGQARRLGEDAIFLSSGRIAESGPATDLLHTPRSDQARAWIEGRIVLDTHSNP